MSIGEFHKSGDFKAEKHVPVIECSDSVAADEYFEVRASMGAEIAHPNTTEHHIRWIRVYFKPDGDNFAYEVANLEFCAHGESAKGPNEGPVYTDHCVTCRMKVKSAGTLVATSFCNIHGLWESEKRIELA